MATAKPLFTCIKMKKQRCKRRARLLIQKVGALLRCITLADENYWDMLHYNRATADKIAELIAQGVAEKQGAPGYFEYLSE